MSREDLEGKLRSAEETLQQAATRLEGTETRLESLEQERAATLGEAEIARRTLTDVDRVIADLREELASLEVEEARQALTAAAQGRDKLVAEAAAALETAVRLLDEVETHRAAVAEAHERLLSLSPTGRPGGRAAAPEEPDILHEPWQRMVAAVKDRLDEELESEAVDAAARSHAPYAINALPEHLRPVAMERRRKFQQAGLDRLRETRERLQVVERDEPSRRA